MHEKEAARVLTDANKKARMMYGWKLLRRYTNHMVKFIWFSDEKLFSEAAPFNTQNDCLCVPSATKKRDTSATRLLKTRSSFSKSVMVSVAL